jgi:hypothetical protein
VTAWVISSDFVEQAPVTNWPLRILLVGVVMAITALVLWAMWRGWQGRLRRQGDLPMPASDAPGPWQMAAEGMMLGTSSSGDWLDRIVVADLGVPSRSVMHFADSGVWIERIGARSVFIPSPQIRGVRLDRGVAGMVREKDGVLVVTWQLGDRLVDTGFRADDPATQRRLLDGVMALVEQG